jgi:cystathionine beta-lyase
LSFEGFDDLSLDLLQARRSEKWVRYPSDVLPAWVAEMDFPLAPPVRDALLAAVERNDTGYANPGDLPVAFSDYALSRFEWTVPPDRVFVAGDVMLAAAAVLRLTTAGGDAVVVNTPAYPPFFVTIPAVERRVVEVPLVETEQGWELDFEGLEHAFAAGARAYLLCNPHNPTGRVLRRSDLEQVAELASRYDIVVIADEIHAPLTLPGAVHTPYVSLGEEAARRGVTLTGASKAWNIPGLKCGLIVAGSSAMKRELEGVSKLLRDQTGLFGVLASTAAFREGGPWVEELLGYLDGNRRYLADAIPERLPGVGYRQPEASYLAWLDCRSVPLGEDPAAVFLDRGRVALTRGLDFGREGAGFARLNFGTSRALLEEAVRRLAAAVG